MVSSRRRRQLKKQKQRAAEEARRRGSRVDVHGLVERLPPDILAEIHHHLPFLQRLAFASVCGASGHQLRPEAPWLLLPGETDETATILSMDDGAATATVRTSDPAMRGHAILGSSGGWLVTADARGTLRMANPATGAQAELPAIATIPFLNRGGKYSDWFWFRLDVVPFLRVRFGGLPPPADTDWGRPNLPLTDSLSAAQKRERFYRKVVLSASPRPGSYAAMLIPERHFGAPAFTTAADPVWRMAPSRDGVEDAIHHNGRFYSVTYAGDVEAWDRDAATGEFTSTVAAPRLDYEVQHLRRKYLAAAAADGRLMAVLKYSRDVEPQERYYPRCRKVTRVFFKVQILEQGRWEEAADIGDAALFVGVNGSLCVSTTGYPGVRAGCIYFTDDEVGEACVRHGHGRGESSSYRELNDDEVRNVGVYNMVSAKVNTICDGSGKQRRWPPPVWFTPSFL